MATFTFNQIKIAVDRAEKAANTFINVASSQQDFTPAEFQDIKTLKRRITDHLDIQLEEFRGDDGLSVDSIDIENNIITITYSDNTTQTYDDLSVEGILDYTVTNGELIETLTDSSATNLGQVVGDSGNLSISATVEDDGTLTIDGADGSTYSIGNIDNFGENPITAVRQEDGDLFVELNGEWIPDPVGRVKGDPGELGVLPVEKPSTDILVTWNGVDEVATLTIEREGTTPIVLDNMPFTRRIADPEDTLQLDSSTGENIFTLATGARLNLGEFDARDGADAEDGKDADENWGNTVSGYERLKFKNDDFALGAGYPVLRAVDPQSNTILSLRGVYNDVYADDVTISDATIVNGEAIVTIAFTDENENPITQDINIGEVVGNDGETLTDINILSNGDVVASYEKAGDVIIGNIKYDRIASASLDPISGKIKITMDSGDVIETTNTDIIGQDGIARSIQTIIIDYANEGMLSLQMNAGDDILDIGFLRPLKSHSVDVSIDGDLAIQLDDDASPRALGNIRGTDSSRDVTDVLFDGTVFTLVINGVDNEVLADALEKFSGVEYDHTLGEIAFTRGTRTYTISYQRGDDGEHGDWIEAEGWDTPVDADGYRHLTITTKDGVEYVTDLIQDTDYITSIYRSGEDIRYGISSPTGAKTDDILAGSVVDFNGDDGAIPLNIQIEDLNLWFRDWTDGSPDYDAGQVVSRWVEDFSFDGNNDQVFFQYNTETAPEALPLFLRGEDARYPVSIVINANRELEATFNNGDVEIIGEADGVDAQYITDFTRTGDIFTITYNDASTQTLTIPNFDGILPRWITEFIINDDRQFAVRYASTDYDLNETVDDSLTVIGEADGVDAQYITELSRTDDDFSATWDDESVESVESVGSIESFDGEDARWIVSIDRTGEDFTVNLTDGTETFTFLDYDGADGKFVSDITIDSNRHLIVSWHENDKPDEDLGYIDYDEGIENIYIDTDGFLVVEHRTKPDVVSSRPIISLVTGVEQVDDVLSISTTDSTDDIDVGYVAGADYSDGRYITNIYRDAERLMVDMSDNTTLDAGAFLRREITDYVLEGDLLNELVLRYTDGTEQNLGNVRGESSTLNIVSAFINQDYALVLTLDDPTTPEALDPIIIPGVRGDDGNGIVEANIVESELIFTMDDETTINIGTVSIDFGFAPYNPETIYIEAQSMTLDGKIYVAQRDGVEVTPAEDAGAWTTVRLEGDPTPDAGRPDVIFPVDEVFENRQPFLLGSEIRNYFSPDTLKQREFEIDLLEGDFSSPLYSASENMLGHQVEDVLSTDVDYKWRIRDIIDIDGVREYTTTWSASAPFTATQEDISRPSVFTAAGLDQNAMIARAGFESSDFFGSGSHTGTSWQIVRDVDGVVVYDDINGEDLTSTVIPWDTLRSDTEYRVRVKHHSASSESAWSAWLTIKTRVQFQSIEIKPVVSFIGDDINATVAKPFFKSNSDLGEFWDEYMGRKGVRAAWEVYTSTDALVWTADSAIDITSLQAGVILDSGQSYKIRVRYQSDDFIGPSDWSEFVTFTPQWSISVPFVSYGGDVTEVVPSPIFESSESVYVNDSHRFTQWKVEDLEGNILYSNNDFESFAWQVFFGFEDSEQTRRVFVRNHGRYAASEWSDPLEITLQEFIETFVFTGSTDDTTRKLDTYGSLLWTYDHTNNVNFVFADVLGNVYVAGESTNVTKIDANGDQIWQYTGHTSNVCCLSATQTGELYTASWDNTLRLLDSETGALEGTFSGFGDNVRAVSASYDNSYLYAGDQTGLVKRLEPTTMTEIWSVSVNAGVTRAIITNENGYVVCSSLDGYVRALDKNTGSVLWTYGDGTTEFYEIDMDANENVVVGDANGNVHFIDNTGTAIWVKSVHTDEVFGVAIDDYGFMYSSGRDGNVNKINGDGDVVWTYSDHNELVRTVDVVRIAQLLPPSDVKSEYIEFQAPTNLTVDNYSPYLYKPTGVVVDSYIPFFAPDQVESEYITL